MKITSMTFSRIIQIIVLGSIVACGGGGGGENEDADIPQASTLKLATLDLSIGQVNELLSSNNTNYTSTMAYMTESIEIRASAEDGASVTVNGEIVNAETSSSTIALQEGSNFIDIDVVSSDGTQSRNYTLNVTRQTQKRFSQSLFIKETEPTRYGNFGTNAVIDGNTMVVVAANDVHIYENSTGSWVLETILEPIHGTSLGNALALEGDTLVIGKWWEKNSVGGINQVQTDEELDGSGAVYVFVKVGGEWTLQAHIKADEPIEYDSLGGAVALNGDTLVIGAPGHPSSVPENTLNGFVFDAGSAYVYERTDDVWSFVTRLTAAYPTGGDRFGSSVAVNENTIVIGAHKEDSEAQGLNGNQDSNIGPDSGAVFIYENLADEWILQAYLKPADSKLGTEFGNAVRLHGDLLFVAAFRESEDPDGFDYGGGVYIFSKSDGWSELALLKPDREIYQFGECIATNGNYLMVGASFENGRGSGITPDYHKSFQNHAGAIILFENQNGSWNQVATLKPSNPYWEAHFGRTCAISEDLMVVPFPEERSSGSGINPNQSIFDPLIGSGAVYIYPIN
jgi:cadherin-like protein/FG-GAP repeat protein